MKKHPDIGRKVNWAGQLCEIADATKHQVRLKFSNAAGAAEFWLDRTGMLYWADDRTPGTAPTLTLVDWLKACGCRDVRPVIVTIDGQSWYGCRYIGVGQYTKEMDAVRRGANQAGQSYEQERIYCAGGLPKCYGKRQEGKVCFQFQGAEWYVVGYIMAKKILPQFAASHHFGENFILGSWNIPDSKIDDGERKPHVRHVMTAIEIPSVWPADLARTCESCQHFRTRTSEDKKHRAGFDHARHWCGELDEPTLPGALRCGGDDYVPNGWTVHPLGVPCPCCTKPKQLFASVHARPAPCPKCRSERQVASRSRDGEVCTVCMKCGRIEKPEAKSL